MNNNKFKIILISSLFLSFPLLASAREDWKLRENKNTLTLAGVCAGEQVRIDLFRENEKKPIYTSGALCQNGNFAFSDDLLQWKSLLEGEYKVVVDGDKQNTKNISLKRPVEADKKETVSAVASKEDIALSPENKFLNSFIILQQSILDMRQWLAETKYPAFVKGSMEFALDGVDFAVAKVSDLVLSSESGENAPESNPAEAAISATDIPAETPATVTPIESTQPLIPDPSAGTDEVTIDMTNGALTVDGGSETTQ